MPLVGFIPFNICFKAADTCNYSSKVNTHVVLLRQKNLTIKAKFNARTVPHLGRRCVRAVALFGFGRNGKNVSATASTSSAPPFQDASSGVLSQKAPPQTSSAGSSMSHDVESMTWPATSETPSSVHHHHHHHAVQGHNGTAVTQVTPHTMGAHAWDKYRVGKTASHVGFVLLLLAGAAFFINTIRELLVLYPPAKQRRHQAAAGQRGRQLGGSRHKQKPPSFGGAVALARGIKEGLEYVPGLNVNIRWNDKYETNFNVPPFPYTESEGASGSHTTHDTILNQVSTGTRGAPLTPLPSQLPSTPLEDARRLKEQREREVESQQWGRHSHTPGSAYRGAQFDSQRPQAARQYTFQATATPRYKFSDVAWQDTIASPQFAELDSLFQDMSRDVSGERNAAVAQRLPMLVDRMSNLKPRQLQMLTLRYPQLQEIVNRYLRLSVYPKLSDYEADMQDAMKLAGRLCRGRLEAVPQEWFGGGEEVFLVFGVEGASGGICADILVWEGAGEGVARHLLVFQCEDDAHAFLHLPGCMSSNYVVQQQPLARVMVEAARVKPPMGFCFFKKGELQLPSHFEDDAHFLTSLAACGYLLSPHAVADAAGITPRPTMTQPYEPNSKNLGWDTLFDSTTPSSYSAASSTVMVQNRQQQQWVDEEPVEEAADEAALQLTDDEYQQQVLLNWYGGILTTAAQRGLDATTEDGTGVHNLPNSSAAYTHSQSERGVVSSTNGTMDGAQVSDAGAAGLRWMGDGIPGPSVEIQTGAMLGGAQSLTGQQDVQFDVDVQFDSTGIELLPYGDDAVDSADGSELDQGNAGLEEGTVELNSYNPALLTERSEGVPRIIRVTDPVTNAATASGAPLAPAPTTGCPPPSSSTSAPSDGTAGATSVSGAPSTNVPSQQNGWPIHDVKKQEEKEEEEQANDGGGGEAVDLSGASFVVTPDMSSEDRMERVTQLLERYAQNNKHVTVQQEDWWRGLPVLYFPLLVFEDNGISFLTVDMAPVESARHVFIIGCESPDDAQILVEFRRHWMASAAAVESAAHHTLLPFTPEEICQVKEEGDHYGVWIFKRGEVPLSRAMSEDEFAEKVVQFAVQRMTPEAQSV